jgi:hypothetical protein
MVSMPTAVLAFPASPEQFARLLTAASSLARRDQRAANPNATTTQRSATGKAVPTVEAASTLTAVAAIVATERAVALRIVPHALRTVALVPKPYVATEPVMATRIVTHALRTVAIVLYVAGRMTDATPMLNAAVTTAKATTAARKGIPTEAFHAQRYTCIHTYIQLD